MPDIRDLSDVSKKNTELVGGKAASLGEMIKAGIAVPPGFVITAKAYSQGMTPELEKEILEAFKKRSLNRVAVRSSAVAEDSAGASWAGQLETYLNVTKSGLIEAIQKCWASIQSEHAQAYGDHHGVKQEDRAVAVVVQAMVDSDVSGVMFTVNPVTNNKKEIVIESVYGLGEMIVQGTVTPENFIVNKHSAQITTHSPSSQKAMLVYKDDKNRKVPVPSTKLKSPTLSAKQIKELTDTAKKIERHYGHAQDIEWAISGGKLFIVQSRPITTFNGDVKPPDQPKAPKGVKYALTVPQSVLFADLSLQGNRRDVFKRLGMDYEPAYISIDAGGAMSWDYDNDKDFDAVLLKNGSAADAMGEFIGLMERTEQDLDKVSKDIGAKRIAKAEIPKLLRAYWRSYEEHMTSLFTFWNVERLLSDTLIDELKKAGRHDDIDDGLVRYLKPDKPNYFVKERMALRKLINEFKITPSTTLAGSKGLAEALEKHRDKYGFLLAPFNLDNPLSINDLLERAKELAAEPSPDKGAPDDFADLTPELRHLAVLAQRFTFWKSERLDLFALADSRVKELYREAAAALSLEPNDFFAMTADEIVSSLRSGKAVVSGAALKQRQTAYCLILFDGKIDFYEPSVGAVQDHGGQVSELTGTAASTGVVTGKVRLINDLKDAKQLKRGEVVVTAMTRPEMGVALDRAAAFVTDEGGLLCHAAIISREMKKPCVIATGNATKVLKDGQDIEVDGSKGIVKVLGD